MVYFIFYIIGLSFLVLQTTLLQILPKWMGAPDLLFVLLVFCALRLEVVPGILLALSFGFMLDLVAGIFLGIHATVYLLLFLLLKIISQKFALQYLQHQPILTALSYLLFSCSTFLLNTILAGQNSLIWSWKDVLLGTLLVSIFSIPLNQFFLMILSLFTPRRRDIPRRPTLKGSRGYPQFPGNRV